MIHFEGTINICNDLEKLEREVGRLIIIKVEDDPWRRQNHMNGFFNFFNRVTLILVFWKNLKNGNRRVLIEIAKNAG